MKNRIFVCPICHGMGTIDSLVACNVDDSKRHSLNCICMGLGFVGKKVCVIVVMEKVSGIGLMM